MLLGRPIPVWVIFCYVVYNVGVAVWIAVRIATALPGDPYADIDIGRQYDIPIGVGLAISLIPAAVLLTAVTSLFALRRWAVWPLAAVFLMIASSLWSLPPTSENTVWAIIALGVLCYSVWLRQRGVLR